MSRHYFSTHLADQPITVVLGWDRQIGELARPAGFFFMLVERDCPDPGQADYLYLSTDSPSCLTQTLDDFEYDLLLLGIEVPQEIFQAVALDAKTGQCDKHLKYAAYDLLVQ